MRTIGAKGKSVNRRKKGLYNGRRRCRVSTMPSRHVVDYESSIVQRSIVFALIRLQARYVNDPRFIC